DDVYPTRLVWFGGGLAKTSVDHHVEEDDRTRAIVVPEVVMNLLEVPAIFACGRLDRHHRGRKQVVAGADSAIEIWSRIAGREVNQPELRIDRGCLPDAGAAMQPRFGVLRPRVVANLAGTRNRIEGPNQVAVFGVERFHASAGAVFGAGKSDDHHPVVIE